MARAQNLKLVADWVQTWNFSVSMAPGATTFTA